MTCPNCGGPDYPVCCGRREEPYLYSEPVRLDTEWAWKPARASAEEITNVA
jgi:hypothetical protein